MRPLIAITMGDAAGIGAEIALKALTHERIYEICSPIIVGDASALAAANVFAGLQLREIKDPSHAKGEYGTAEFINLGKLDDSNWEFGEVSPACGDAAYADIERAIAYAMDKKVDAVVTGPINKEALNLAGHHFSGHTEIFAKLTGTKDYAMMLTSPMLKVIHVSTHNALCETGKRATEERVYAVIKLAQQAMRLLGIARPRIAVAGLNPHSSENGLFGHEEQESIIPAIERAKGEGIDVDGPVPPDTVFVKAMAKQYDIVVAMYHDQGHIPVKLSGFTIDEKTGEFESRGVNITIGLPIIRTSVDHGTAFDRAGKGMASEGSMLDSIDLAVEMARNWGKDG